jgi:hypothetical protein
VEDGEVGGDARRCRERGGKGEGSFSRLRRDDQAKNRRNGEKKDKAKLATIHRFSAGDGQHARSLQEIFASFTIAREISALA